MMHFFNKPISDIALPKKFTYPFHYTPHPLCVMAAEEVKTYLSGRQEWKEELSLGKMFGVLLVKDTANDTDCNIGFLAAFSGNLAGKNTHSYFVPPIYDLLQPDGLFKTEENNISEINKQIELLTNASSYLELKKKLQIAIKENENLLSSAKAELKVKKKEREQIRQSNHALTAEEESALIRESQHQKAELKRLEGHLKEKVSTLLLEIKTYEDKITELKAERKERSAALQQKLFEQYRVLNANGGIKDLFTIFGETVGRIPPGGAGECALPKLLQYAYLHHLKPLAMAEFWWGGSPKNEIRQHGNYYPSCKGKCEPILQHMLQGLEVDDNPLEVSVPIHKELEIVFEDEWLLVINKPAGMLSVPGKNENIDSVYRYVKAKYPDATGPIIVHRLDMATSGLLLLAKTQEVHKHLQEQFQNRSIKKRYVALLDGVVKSDKLKGTIDLALSPNLQDRPRQMVDATVGKPALTNYQILGYSKDQTRIVFCPVTGRTHQLRIHAAHTEGLGHPIVGDALYGKKSDRLYLHAEYIEFRHPIYGDIISIQKKAEF